MSEYVFQNLLRDKPNKVRITISKGYTDKQERILLEYNDQIFHEKVRYASLEDAEEALRKLINLGILENYSILDEFTTTSIKWRLYGLRWVK